MNDTERHNCELFTRSLELLHVNEDGLTDETDYDDIKAISQVCPQIKQIANPAKHLNSSRCTGSPR